MAAVDENTFYVFGGRTRSSSVTDAVQRFDIRTKAWEELKLRLPIKMARMGVAVGVKGDVFIVGGEVSGAE